MITLPVTAYGWVQPPGGRWFAQLTRWLLGVPKFARSSGCWLRWSGE